MSDLVHVGTDAGIQWRDRDGNISLLTLEDLAAVVAQQDAGELLVCADGEIGADVAAVLEGGRRPLQRVAVPPGLALPDGLTAAMLAARNGAVWTLDDLARRGADLAAVDRFGRSALHHASAEGQVEAVTWLLGRGIDPSAPDGQGRTPLLHAVLGGWGRCADALAAGGADPTEVIDGLSLRSWAAAACQLELAGRLGPSPIERCRTLDGPDGVRGLEFRYRPRWGVLVPMAVVFVLAPLGGAVALARVAAWPSVLALVLLAGAAAWTVNGLAGVGRRMCIDLDGLRLEANGRWVQVPWTQVVATLPAQRAYLNEVVMAVGTAPGIARLLVRAVRPARETLAEVPGGVEPAGQPLRWLRLDGTGFGRAVTVCAASWSLVHEVPAHPSVAAWRAPGARSSRHRPNPHRTDHGSH